MEDKEISNEDVKKEFEEINQTELVEATEDPSTSEKETSESSPEDVKPVTEEVQEVVEEEPKVIPYARFKEVNTKLKDLEDLAEQAKEFIVKDPVTGKLSIKTVEAEQPKEEEGLKLSDEEQLALDSVQINVINKLLDQRIIQREKQAEQLRLHNQETDKWWGKAKEEYPELTKADFKETPLYKRAVQILKDQHVVWSPDKKSFYIPPKAQYWSVLQADKELQREKVKTSQAKLEEKKNIKQQVFVEKKSGQVQAKKKTDEKEFESLSIKDQEDALREQWNETHPDE